MIDPSNLRDQPSSVDLEQVMHESKIESMPSTQLRAALKSVLRDSSARSVEHNDHRSFSSNSDEEIEP